MTTEQACEKFKKKRDRIRAARQAPADMLKYIRDKFHDQNYDIRFILKNNVMVWNLIYWKPLHEVYVKHPEFAAFGEYPVVLPIGFWKQFGVEADTLNWHTLRALQWLPSVKEREKAEDAEEAELDAKQEADEDEMHRQFAEERGKGMFGRHIREIQKIHPGAVQKKGYIVIDHRKANEC